MGIDATTFILEIVNFLVLLWLLTRFLYRPLQAAIASRQQQYEQARQALQADRDQLETQRQELAARHAEMTSQHDQAHRQMVAEIEAERARRLAALQSELNAERIKAEARLSARLEQQTRQQNEAATRHMDAFLRHYLERLAGPELEQAIVNLFLADLAALPDERRHSLQDGAAATVEVASAYDMTEPQRQQVEQALSTLLGITPPLRWQRDPTLLSGLSVRLGGYVLEASLAKSFDALHSMEATPNRSDTA